MGTLAALAARAQLGDRAAMEGLLRQLQGPLGRHVRAILGNDDETADVLQETLLVISRQLRSVRELEAVRAWAFRVATRKAMRAVRRERRRLMDPFDTGADPPAPSPEEPMADAELLAELRRRVDSLPHAARVVLRLRYFEELTQPEIAQALEIPLGTVKSRLAYGLAALRRDWVTER